MRFLVVVVALMGCQRHKSDCAPAVGGAIDRMVADARAKMPPPVAANIARIVPQMKSGIIASCEADHWSPQVIECITKANGKEQLDLCDAMLTPKQRENEHKRNDELLKSAVQPLVKPGQERVKRDPHEGLGIPPADQLHGVMGSGGAAAGSGAPGSPAGSAPAVGSPAVGSAAVGAAAVGSAAR